MAKTSVKFQNDWPKTVGRVALTRHPLTIRVLGKNYRRSCAHKSIVDEWTNGRTDKRTNGRVTARLYQKYKYVVMTKTYLKQRTSKTKRNKKTTS